MNLEIIITTILAMISSMLPFVYKKITDSAYPGNPYIILAAVILGVI